MNQGLDDVSLLQALFDSFPTAVLVANDQGFYVGANNAACELVGRPRSALLGLHLSDLVAPGRRAEVDLQWRAFVRDGTQSGVFHITMPDGSSRALAFHAKANFTPGFHCSFLTPAARPPDARSGDDASLLTLCAWTNQVRLNGTWVSMEEYLDREHHLAVTHGISPAAFDHLVRESDASSG